MLADCGKIAQVAARNEIAQHPASEGVARLLAAETAGRALEKSPHVYAAALVMLDALRHFVNHCEAAGIPARADSLVQERRAHAMARAALAQAEGRT